MGGAQPFLVVLRNTCVPCGTVFIVHEAASDVVGGIIYWGSAEGYLTGSVMSGFKHFLPMVCKVMFVSSLCGMNQLVTTTSAPVVASGVDQKQHMTQGKKLTTSASAPSLLTLVAASDKESKESAVSCAIHADWPAYKWPKEANDFFYRKEERGLTQVQEYVIDGHYWLFCDLLKRAQQLHTLEAVLLDSVTVFGLYYACNVLHIAAINNQYLTVEYILAVAQSEGLLAKILFQPHVRLPSDILSYADVDNKDPVWTELHEAAERGNVYIVALLLHAAQNNKIEVPNVEGAVTIAWRNNRRAVLQVFEQFGYAFDCSLCGKSVGTCCCNDVAVREASWFDGVMHVITRIFGGCRRHNHAHGDDS